jgi:hypothetical protein
MSIRHAAVIHRHALQAQYVLIYTFGIFLLASLLAIKRASRERLHQKTLKIVLSRQLRRLVSQESERANERTSQRMKLLLILYRRNLASLSP